LIELETSTLRNNINKAFLKETVARSSFDVFKQHLSQFLNSIETAHQQGEHEEHIKNLLVSFLNKIGFEERFVNTNAYIDLAIHTGADSTSPVGVILEVKRPSNRSEMISVDDINRKALHEAVLYYLEQRIEHENSDLKQIIITDTLNWFVFDAQEFERCFYRPSTLKKTYRSWKSNQKVSSNKEFMYGEIDRYLNQNDARLEGLYLNLEDYGQWLKAQKESRYEKKLIPLYKLFSPIHLLKEPFANDSNTLNRNFYRELLYILGLEEVKEGNTRYIERAGKEKRQSGSLIENAIRILETEDHLSRMGHDKNQYGNNRSEQIFSIALELSITWMNRILFLKLLESQLFRYHRQDKNFKFLQPNVIGGYDELNKLFFQVLARRVSDRPEDVNAKFGHIPYLNSSLFDLSMLEHQTLRISNLDDSKSLPVYKRSVLSDLRGTKRNTLNYLFEFLEAYDFAAEGGEEIQEERKTLINASVLGLIFEKINGYKDGSFFTPGFITEYMAKETLRKAVRDKFGDLLALSTDPTAPHSGSLPGGERTPSSLPSPAGGRTEDVGEKAPNRGMSGETPREPLPEDLLKKARNLRKKQTKSEDVLWQLLRRKQLNGAKFRRQHPIKEGIILDFYCHTAKLAIEIDGGYHDTEAQKARDAERTQILNEMGIRLIRFRNEVVLENTEVVLEEIAEALIQNPTTPHSGSLPGGERTPSSLPSPAGGRTEDGGEKSVTQAKKVKNKDKKSSPTFTQIYNAIGREISIAEANEIVNSITICDPAVGSGHFLVSCLNELLAIKSDLGILCDEEGRVLRSVKIVVENDELIVTWGNEELFEYDAAPEWHGTTFAKRKIDPERQRIQKTLFQEKRHFIENCLFGVDINANSVKICRLRLWIELLKNTYYTARSEHMELEVLPNIDINIKTGNSLVSRFDLDSDLSAVFSDSISNSDSNTDNQYSLEDYKKAVRSYKETGDRSEKRRLQELIRKIKKSYTASLLNNRPINKKLSKQTGKLELMQNADLFGEKKFTKKEIKKQQQKVEKLEKQKAGEESGAFYHHAFEWRFEFPEVLDEEGRFTGFDVVIGNPPYIRQEQLKELKPYFKSNFTVYHGSADLYSYFIEKGLNLLREQGLFHYIVSNKWMRANYGKPLREWMQQYQIESIIDFGDLPVFEEATVYPCLLEIRKAEYESNFTATEVDSLEFSDLTQYLGEVIYEVDQNKLNSDGWALINKKSQNLLEKVNKKGVSLEKYVDGNIYRGVVTGLNKAFVIDEELKNKIISKNPKSKGLIKPFLGGRDIKRYQIPNSDKFIIMIPSGWTDKQTESENKWKWFSNEYPVIAEHLFQFRERAVKRYDQGKYWWELRACDYYDQFETKKIMYQVFQVKPCFTYDVRDSFSNNSIWIIPNGDKVLLAILNSKVGWFLVSNFCTQIRNGYQLILKYFGRIPLPSVENKLKSQIKSLVDQILTAKKDNPEADTTELESEIDQLVYELYGLSEEEIEIVEESVG